MNVTSHFAFSPAGGGWTYAIAESLWSNGAGTEYLLAEQTNTLRNSLRSGVRVSKPSEILLSDEVSDEA